MNPKEGVRMEKLGVIGAGNMAGAIIGGILGAGLLQPEEICVFDRMAEKVEHFAAQGLVGCESAAQVARRCKYLLLSIKPQNFDEVLPQLREDTSDQTVFISIAAGISPDYICRQMGRPCRVVQVMPNTPLLIGRGAVAISRVEPTTDEEFAFAKALFASAGLVEEIDNRLMNEVIALNGSSPAYIYRFAKVFCDHAAGLGIGAEAANRLFCQALIGSAHMMMESGMSHQQLIDMVTSPGGTTFAGLEALSAGDFDQTLRSCYDATTKRAYELGK